MKMMVMKCVIVCAVCFVFNSPLLAADTKLQQADAKQQAVTLLEQGNNQGAYDLLKKHYEKKKDDVELAFLLGQAAMALNHPAEAAELYEGILAKNNNLPRVRLELGRTYAALGERQKAKDQFHAVLATNPPPVVGDNIRKFIASLESHKNWNVRLSAGYIYDSNVNAGPADSSVLMFGVPFQLSRDAQKNSDHGYTVSLGAGHLLDFNKELGLQTDFQYSRTGYSKLHAFNSDILSLSTGPTLRQDSYIFSMPFVFEYLMIGQKRYDNAVGIAPQVMVPITDRLIANASWTGQIKNYYVNDGMRNGTIWSANAGAKYFLWQNGFVQASYRYTQENTKRDYLNNRSNGMNLGFYAGLPAGFSLYVSPGVAYTNYEAKEAAYDERRKDTQYTAMANISKDFGTTGLSVALGYTFTRNDSNLTMYDYNRNQVTAQLSWAF